MLIRWKFFLLTLLLVNTNEQFTFGDVQIQKIAVTGEVAPGVGED